MEKRRWEKAEHRLRKSLARDTLNASLRHALSVFYFHPENPDFHLDSAYHYAVTALADYQLSPQRERERVRRMNVDSLGLTALRARIDSAAFEVARERNTEESYLEFLSHFPTAMQKELAAKLRDEVAFQDALVINTPEAFNRYLTRYPESVRVPEARARYERLLYQDATKDQRLSSFERFLAEHPETPYREEIYRNIFEISTADGHIESFLSFMTRYPVSNLVTKAGQIIFYILAEEEEPDWPERVLNDSLLNLLDLNKTYLVPFLKDDRYGFMDDRGFEIIEPAYKAIHPDYLCGHITDEVLIVDDRLVLRNGSTIYEGVVTEVTDIGIGFLKVETPQGTRVIHKAGFAFADSVEDARIIGKSFVAIKKNDAWSLYTLAGRKLGERSWNDITAIQNVIVFDGGRHKFVSLRSELGKSADGHPLPLSEPFEEVKHWTNGLIWGRAGDYEGVLDQSLHGVIRFDRQRLAQSPFGAVATMPNGFVLYNWQGRRSTTVEQVSIMGKRVGVRKNGVWYLFDPAVQNFASKAYDTLTAEGPFAIGRRADSVYVHFADNHVKMFFRPQSVAFVPGSDSTSFLVVHDRGSDKIMFDLKGRKLFSAAFEKIEYAGAGVFVVTRRDKKGLLGMSGETLLAAEFDAIGSAREEVISLLKNKKFGAYHIPGRKLVKANYDRNLLPYAGSFLITFKDGYYGLLGWDSKPASPFEFEEISFWNDSLALVKKDGLWNLYDLAARKTTEINMRSINMVRDTREEKIAIIQKENRYGVVSNQGRIVIPPTYSDIINVGSSVAPLYFTERNIPEASLYIVIYYDRTGEILRKEIYDDSAVYDKIYCSDP